MDNLRSRGIYIEGNIRNPNINSRKGHSYYENIDYISLLLQGYFRLFSIDILINSLREDEN